MGFAFLKALWGAASGAALPYVLAGILALALGVYGWGWWQHSTGYAQGSAAVKAEYIAATLKEQNRQAAINATVKEQERADIKQLDASDVRLEDQFKENAVAAAKDPLRDACGLGADSVRRLDAIR